MKNYPRIHSLGAVNIIHHQSFDYDFHPFRTDFTGDSGVGKSIITDLIQLIIIGSTEYESSTKGQDDRPFNTLVIESKEKGDFGYAYLNVEVEYKKYLLIGCYIERNSKKSQSFIIQSSLDFEKDQFEPFDKVIRVDDFEENNKWLSLNDFDSKMNQSENYGCKIYNVFRDFHQALSNNNLLPIDIANSKSNLKDYAKILQAFARKGISIKGDVQLQEFLFGKDEQYFYYNEYQDTVKQLEDTVALHRKNKKEIETMKSKAASLQTLYDLKKLKDAAEKEFIVIDWSYQKQLLKTLNVTIKNTLKNYFKARSVILNLNKLKTQKLKECEIEISEIQPQFDELQLKFTDIKSRLEFVENCNKIISQLNLASIVELEHVLRNVAKEKRFKESLVILKRVLDQLNILDLFASFDYSEGLQPVLKKVEHRVDTISKKLLLSRELLKFNDFENPESLSYWILERNKPCTLKEESVLRHFQTLKTIEPIFPKKGDKFISNPEEIINQLSKEDTNKDSEGLWLNLSGLKVYIKLIEKEKQIFNVNDNTKIKEHLLQSRSRLRIEVENYETKLNKLEVLQSFLIDDILNIPDAIPAWISQDQLTIPDEIYNVALKVIEVDYKEKMVDISLHEKIRSDHKSLGKKISSLKTKLSNLRVIQQQLPTIETVELDLVDQHILHCAETFKVSEKPEEIRLVFDEKLFALEFQKEYNFHKKVLEDIISLSSWLDDKRSIEDRILEIETNYGEYIPRDANPSVKEIDFNDSEKKHENAKKKYSEQFKGILIGNQIDEEINQFGKDQNFLDLVRVLLPQELFRDISFDESAVVPKIMEYLEKINDANARINQNKLIKIRDLLQKLQSKVNSQVSHCKRINAFLKEDYAQITSSNKASLKSKLRDDISLEWISDFLTSLSQLEYGLFERDNSLTSKLEELPTLEEKILLAYKEHSKAPMTNPKVKELLNPYSYYTLDYKLVTQNGKKNSGSTGQTYTSLALLCIAKLSLIKEKNNLDNRALRFLSIDEAEGIGSNFDTLKDIALEYDYQIISLGINPNKLSESNQYIYRLSKREDEERINHHPSVILCEW
ncbi:MAG: hypothetical protein CMB99_11515 [Flavobacteriaceae bacterium]|nr:hypothetical protein [Flavobacteriaceae bacterium]|tara:strand:- start:7957 stop:11175 length:3219 start_codon:yes stop_codon:yes gene_type:complete